MKLSTYSKDRNKSIDSGMFFKGSQETLKKNGEKLISLYFLSLTIKMMVKRANCFGKCLKVIAFVCVCVMDLKRAKGLWVTVSDQFFKFQIFSFKEMLL